MVIKMIGIYKDDFVDFLREKLGSHRVKVKSKNIVCSCPWCEYEIDKNQYHSCIDLRPPIL